MAEWPRSLPVWILCLTLGTGCRSEEVAPAEDSPLARPPIDAAVAASVEAVKGWAYRRALDADLTGDGAPERVVLTSDVTLTPDGQPLWEDGHRWAVYVEEGEEQTLLYSAFVPNGFSEAAVSPATEGARAEVLISERTPQHLRILTVEYLGAGRARAGTYAQYLIESWLPGFATIP